MKLLFLNHLENARDSLRANRMRTFLTISGVAIGIASIVAILSLASGASQIVANQVDEAGGTIAVIRPGLQTADSISTSNSAAVILMLYCANFASTHALRSNSLPSDL